MFYVDGHGDPQEMTLPDERYRAVKWAESFLSRLASGEYPRVPRAVRDEARSILRHYPGGWDMHRAAQGAPDVFQEQMEDLHRFVLHGEQQRSADFNPEANQPHSRED